MPIIAHCDLPAFDRLRGEGYDVLRPEEALRQDIRELHVGLLNLMPDAALRATERQFLRLLGACNRIVQIRVHLITVDEPSRGVKARDYLGRYYERFDEIRRVGLDALVVSGANPARSRLEEEDFWEPMLEILDWAEEHVHSVLCSCLSTHAVLQRSYGVERQPRLSKRWGVYSHRVVDAGHPLVRDVNTRFDAPRSHRFEVTSAQLEAA
ncbi:MAG: homoserine O-succinyltransferase, partial [Acidobacteriota bacterium]